MKIKKGDTVLVISGKDRAKTGKVLNLFPKKGTVLVEGLNLRKKHIKPTRSGEKGQIVQVSVPLPVSNLKLICTKCGKATRVGYKKAARGEPRHGREGEKKYRVCKKCGQET